MDEQKDRDEWFNQLSLKRKKFDESVRENNFDKGLRHSTVEKYPDPVHFVYELLQNAEDQGAAEAKFVLSATSLVFYHNGESFTRSDVENITSIGNSDKLQKANKIGRFGIGFKSVFSITDRPEIYTLLEASPFAFAIEHLVVPVAISENHEQNYHHYNTQFIFPFSVGQENALYTKIKERLASLGFESLLFLHNLASIEWQTETDDGVYLRAVKDLRHELSGERNENGRRQQSNTNYLLLTRDVSLSGNDRKLDVRVAFKLDKKGRIVSEPDQKLAVYFPTEQETGQKFLLHGPFLLTDNRANIKIDDDTNSKLIQECAVLLAESIQQIKEMHLLTVDFLSLLPIRKENIPLQFHPLYDHVFRALKQCPLLPTAGGVFASAAEVKLARSVDLRDLIDDQQLSLLYGSSSPLYWLSSEVTADRAQDLYRYLSKNHGVEIVDPETFVRKLEKPFLEKQSDEWLVKLYAFLGKQPHLNNIIKKKPILRLEDNSHVSPFNDENARPNAYLSLERESKYPLVKRSLIADKAAYAFLKGIGLSEPDSVDEVLAFVLPPYKAGEVALHDERRNKQDLDQIQEALKFKGHRARPQLLAMLNEVPFIQAHNAKTSEKAWKIPCEVYYQTEELFIWFDGNEDAWFITDPFPEVLLRDLTISTRFRLTAKAPAGATGHVELQNVWGSHERGLHGFDTKAKLDGLRYALDHITLEKAILLWGFLLEHRHLVKGFVETSNYRNFIDAQRTEKFSEIGTLCSQKRWLPDKHGDFYFPEEMFIRDLSEKFEKDSLEAQEISIKLGMKKDEMLQLADKLGISHEIITLIQDDPETILAWYQEQQQKKPDLPSSITSNPERRKEKAVEMAYTAEVKTYKAVPIHKRISTESREVKMYLRGHNTNEENQLICQLCNQQMPFRLPGGEEHFVACQYIEFSEKEYAANHLALCPNCAAEFQYACQTDGDARADLILDMSITTNEENMVISLNMPVHQHLRFTQKHLIDLQTAIENWLETGPNSDIQSA